MDSSDYSHDSGSEDDALDLVPDCSVNLRDINAVQRQSLRRRLSRKHRRVERLASSSSDNEWDHANKEEVEEAWNLVLETLLKLFFVGEEACFPMVRNMSM